MKQKIAIVRGKYLDRYEMQSYEPLVEKFDLTAFGSQTAFHTTFAFPTVKLVSPLDLPDFPKRMPLLNRLYQDAQYLYGLESSLKGFAIAHTAETYFHLTYQALIAKKKGYVKKIVVTEWENIPFNNEGIRGRSAMKQYALQHADHFIAVSQRSKLTLLLEGADEKKISVISPGIDTRLFSSPQNDEKQKVRKNQINLLYVGRLVISKGVYELLYALVLLCQDKELQKFALRLSLVGSGPEKEKLILLARKLHISDVITFANVTYEEMPNTYQKANIFVAPSKEDMYWQEQWGMALMEAQAAGLSIVTTRSGSIPENVGEAALLIQPGDVLSLYQTIKTLILNPEMRLSLGKKARQRAERIHDNLITAKKIEEVYELLL